MPFPFDSFGNPYPLPSTSSLASADGSPRLLEAFGEGEIVSDGRFDLVRQCTREAAIGFGKRCRNEIVEERSHGEHALNWREAEVLARESEGLAAFMKTALLK